jgi:hypothetical protein
MSVEEGTAGEAGGAEAAAVGLVNCTEVDGTDVGCTDGVGPSEVGDGTTDEATAEGVSLVTGATAGVRVSWRDCATTHVPTDKATVATTTPTTAARH